MTVLQSRSQIWSPSRVSLKSSTFYTLFSYDDIALRRRMTKRMGGGSEEEEAPKKCIHVFSRILLIWQHDNDEDGEEEQEEQEDWKSVYVYSSELCRYDNMMMMINSKGRRWGYVRSQELVVIWILMFFNGMQGAWCQQCLISSTFEYHNYIDVTNCSYRYMCKKGDIWSIIRYHDHWHR